MTCWAAPEAFAGEADATDVSPATATVVRAAVAAAAKTLRTRHVRSVGRVSYPPLSDT